MPISFLVPELSWVLFARDLIRNSKIEKTVQTFEQYPEIWFEYSILTLPTQYVNWTYIRRWEDVELTLNWLWIDFELNWLMELTDNCSLKVEVSRDQVLRWMCYLWKTNRMAILLPPSLQPRLDQFSHYVVCSSRALFSFL